MLHDNLLSHHISLSYPLRWQRLSLPPSSHSPNTTLWGLAAQNTTKCISRHSNLLWSLTAHQCLWEISVPLAMSMQRAEQWGISFLWVDFQVLWLHPQAELAVWEASNRTTPPQRSLLLRWLMGHKTWLWNDFHVTDDQIYCFTISERDIHSQLHLLAPFLPLPLWNFMLT